MGRAGWGLGLALSIQVKSFVNNAKRLSFHCGASSQFSRYLPDAVKTWGVCRGTVSDAQGRGGGRDGRTERVPTTGLAEGVCVLDLIDFANGCRPSQHDGPATAAPVHNY